jgi:integrase
VTYLNQFFVWLFNHGKLSREKGHYFQGKQLKNPKKNIKSNLRYSDEAVHIILNYIPIKPKTGSASGKNWPQAAYWFPKVALYTGMRISEIAELKTCDVYKEDHGGWIVEVTDKGEEEDRYGETRANKTENAIRLIPLHDQLTALGFLEFVAQQKNDRKDDYLFHELFEGKQNIPINGWGDPVGSWFNSRALVKMGLKKPRQTFHSLRSTFISKLKKRGCPTYIAKQIVGHEKAIYNMSTSDITFDGYGGDERTDYDVLHGWVNAVKYLK